MVISCTGEASRISAPRSCTDSASASTITRKLPRKYPRRSRRLSGVRVRARAINRAHIHAIDTDSQCPANLARSIEAKIASNASRPT